MPEQNCIKNKRHKPGQIEAWQAPMESSIRKRLFGEEAKKFEQFNFSFECSVRRPPSDATALWFGRDCLAVQAANLSTSQQFRQLKRFTFNRNSKRPIGQTAAKFSGSLNLIIENSLSSLKSLNTHRARTVGAALRWRSIESHSLKVIDRESNRRTKNREKFWSTVKRRIIIWKLREREMAK